MKPLLMLALGALALASCKTDDTVILNISQDTKDWLADVDSQVLTFANGSGATQTVQVARSADKDRYTGKSFSVRSETEWNYLSYRRQVAADSGFGIAAQTNRISFLNTTSPSRYKIRYVSDLLLGTLPADYIVPYDEPTSGLTLKVRFNQPLGTRSYPAIAMLDIAATDTTGPNVVPNRFRRLYYAKNTGLVGFRTANGQLWLRQ